MLIRFFSYYCIPTRTVPLSSSLFHLLPRFSSTLSVSISIHLFSLSLVSFFSALLTASWSPRDILKVPSHPSIFPTPLLRVSALPTSLFVRLQLPLCCWHHHRHRFSVSPRYLNRLSRDAAIVDNAQRVRESAARGVGAIPHFVPRHPYERWCRRSSLPANFRKCRRVRVLLELSLFAQLVHHFLRLSSFFHSITSVSFSFSSSRSSFRCTVPVREFLPNSVKCDFFGWSKKSPCTA